ncbi:hypothetical protein PROFUN_14935 [Planoprotostelium fungivorum]|uniref:Uncharacterized protein n=1 Tax=Planoprotostelium fungivorum TaxID=1890364 RepID=A0A2P6MYC0_9EUKA|nr:hypothetical protein PROFUN_14935 [Planoprotostelium fungivorum]
MSNVGHNNTIDLVITKQSFQAILDIDYATLKTSTWEPLYFSILVLMSAALHQRWQTVGHLLSQLKICFGSHVELLLFDVMDLGKQTLSWVRTKDLRETVLHVKVNMSQLRDTLRLLRQDCLCRSLVRTG